VIAGQSSGNIQGQAWWFDDKEYTDISTDKRSASFIVDKGDGRIFIK